MEVKIAEIRARFEQELILTQTPTKYSDIDIARVRTEEWQVKRYLLDYQEDVDQAYQALIRTLVWKQSFGVHTRELERDFPRELFDVMRGEIYGNDKEGRLIVSEAYTHQKHFKVG